VLIEFLQVIGKKEKADKVIKFSSYLEFGASSVVALEFIGTWTPKRSCY
jgi:hypothetical protein